MTAAGSVVVVLASLGMIGVILNNIAARISLTEVVLNEGLPPGFETGSITTIASSPDRRLSSGIHLFVSRSCHACQRLLAELEDRRPDGGFSLELHYVDQPRRPHHHDPHRHDGLADLAVHDGEHRLAEALGADPLPYTVASGPHGLMAGSVTPTVAAIAATARQAGLTVEVRTR